MYSLVVGSTYHKHFLIWNGQMHYGYVACLHIVRNVWNVAYHCLLISYSSVTNNYNFGYR